MSYVIVYDKQFIKTSNGITVAVLHGDNNLWEANNKKRVRNWNCWALDKSEDEIRKYFSTWHNDYNQIFVTHGKWVDNAGLDRWVNNGIKNAASIEDVLLANPYRSFECFLSVWNTSIPYEEKGYRKDELHEFIHTTDEFVAWIKKAKERIAEKKTEEDIYIQTSFGSEPLKHGTRNIDPNIKVIAKYKKLYVYKVNNGSWKEAGPDITKAIVFENIEEARREAGYAITFVNAEKTLEKIKERKYVIAAKRNGWNLGYVYSVSKSGFQHTSYSSSAKKYTEAEVKQQIKKLKSRFSDCYEFIPEKITEKETNE